LTFADFTDLDFNDLVALVLLNFRLFKRRFSSPTSAETAHDLTLPLPANLIDFNVLILGTFEDFTLMLLAFLILADLLVAFKLFTDFKLLLE
jgi:hypothetical protein